MQPQDGHEFHQTRHEELNKHSKPQLQRPTKSLSSSALAQDSSKSKVLRNEKRTLSKDSPSTNTNQDASIAKSSKPSRFNSFCEVAVSTSSGRVETNTYSAKVSPTGVKNQMASSDVIDQGTTVLQTRTTNQRDPGIRRSISAHNQSAVPHQAPDLSPDVCPKSSKGESVHSRKAPVSDNGAAVSKSACAAFIVPRKDKIPVNSSTEPNLHQVSSLNIPKEWNDEPNSGHYKKPSSQEQTTPGQPSRLSIDTPTFSTGRRDSCDSTGFSPTHPSKIVISKGSFQAGGKSKAYSQASSVKGTLHSEKIITMPARISNHDRDPGKEESSNRSLFTQAQYLDDKSAKPSSPFCLPYKERPTDKEQVQLNDCKPQRPAEAKLARDTAAQSSEHYWLSSKKESFTDKTDTQRKRCPSPRQYTINSVDGSNGRQATLSRVAVSEPNVVLKKNHAVPVKHADTSNDALYFAPCNRTSIESAPNSSSHRLGRDLPSDGCREAPISKNTGAYDFKMTNSRKGSSNNCMGSRHVDFNSATHDKVQNDSKRTVTHYVQADHIHVENEGNYYPKSSTAQAISLAPIHSKRQKGLTDAKSIERNPVAKRPAEWSSSISKAVESDQITPALKRPRTEAEVRTEIRDTNTGDHQGARVEGGAQNESIISDQETQAQKLEQAIQEYVISYGLLIVERDKNGKATWLCCKLCPIFGCRNRYKGYIMAYEFPFFPSEFVAHLQHGHAGVWEKFSQMTPQMKAEFLKGKNLPKPEAFRKRVAILKKDELWRRRRLERSTTYKSANTSKLSKVKIFGASTTHRFSDNNRPSNKNHDGNEMLPISDASVLLKEPISSSCDVETEQWTGSDDPIYRTGRHRWVSEDNEGDICVEVMMRPSALSDMKRCMEELPMLLVKCKINPKIAIILLKGVLRCVTFDGVNDEDRALLFSDSKSIGLRDWSQPYKEVFVFSDNEQIWEQEISTAVFFYLIRGVQPSVITTFMNSTCGKITGHGKSKLPMAVQVHKFATGICGLGLQLMRKSFENLFRNWCLVLTTRRCIEVGDGGVEVLISYMDAKFRVHRIHLVSVRRKIGAGEVVTNVLDSVCDEWRTRLVGIWTTVGGQDVQAKEVEAEVLDWILKADGIGRDVICLNEGLTLENVPMYPWIFARMEKSKFLELVEPNLQRLVTLKHQDLLRTIIEEWETLRKMEPSSETDCEHMWYQAAWETYQSTTPMIMRLANGMRLLWMADDNCVQAPWKGCLEAGVMHWPIGGEGFADVVDINAERVFWARALLKLRQASDANIDGVSESNQSLGLSGVSGVWGANWSNREFGETL